MNALESRLADHPFLEGMPPGLVQAMSPHAVLRRFREGEFIFRAHEPAGAFFLLTEGSVALMIHGPQLPQPVLIQTISAPHALGWSWMMPPFTWHFDAVAREPAEAVEIDAPKLRAILDDNPAWGYPMLRRIADIMAQRLQATRLQVLDVYRSKH
jgi:CRP-like cAMP-binding protein